MVKLLIINIFFYTITTIALVEMFKSNQNNLWIFLLVIPWVIYITWKVIEIFKLKT